jgi:hypothetical protein
LRVRLWRRELQKLANELNLDIVVGHLVPAPTSGPKPSNASYPLSAPLSAKIGVPSPSAGDCRTDHGYDHQNRPHRAQLTRTQPIPQRHCRVRAKIADLNIKPAEFYREWNRTISPNTYPSKCAFIF